MTTIIGTYKTICILDAEQPKYPENETRKISALVDERLRI